eukprot:1633991-Prymnesium_polylepis.1
MPLSRSMRAASRALAVRTASAWVAAAVAVAAFAAPAAAVIGGSSDAAKGDHMLYLLAGQVAGSGKTP